MAYETALLATSLGSAALLGFAAHRGTICNVKAVEEVLSTRRARLFLSFGKTVLWSLLVTLALLFLIPAVRAEDAIAVSGISLLGGFVCGLGMAINGGCAFATLSRLGEGDVAMVVTLVAFFAGACGAVLATGAIDLPTPENIPNAFDPAEIWVHALLVACIVWAVWELFNLLRTRSPGATFLSPQYRLSTASIFIGMTNGLLFSLYGNWTYTAALTRGARELAVADRWIGQVELLFGGALLLGMLLSAAQRRSFRLRLRPRLSWLRHLLGGLLMGSGAVLIPGGNDSLLLHGIPNLSLHAALAYLSMVLGISTVLVSAKLFGKAIPRIDCSGDLCRTV